MEVEGKIEKEVFFFFFFPSQFFFFFRAHLCCSVGVEAVSCLEGECESSASGVVECWAVAGERSASDEEAADILDIAKGHTPLYNSQTLRVKGVNKPLSYGELQPRLVSTLLRQTRAGPHDTLVDIGSGCGVLVLQAAVQAGCRAFGVEIRPDLHQVAAQLAGPVSQEMRDRKLAMGHVRLHLGDIRAPEPELVQALSEATIVVVNNVVFDEPLNQSIFKLLKSVLRLGCRVLSFRDCFPRLRLSQFVSSDHLLSRFNLPPFQFVSEPNCASWTGSPVRYLIYVVVPDSPISRPNRRSELSPSELEMYEAQLESWRQLCSDLARAGVAGELPEQNSAAPEAEPKLKKSKKQKSHRREAVAAPPPRPRRERAAPPVARKPHWEYIEEKAFFLPPSPDRISRKNSKKQAADIQTRGIHSSNHRAIIRELPRLSESDSTVMTRRQRQLRGEEVGFFFLSFVFVCCKKKKKTKKKVVELRKTVIWTDPEGGNEDYCCVCFDGGDLLCCDGVCFRSFHSQCIGLQEIPEGEFVCDLCSRSHPFDGQVGE